MDGAPAAMVLARFPLKMSASELKRLTIQPFQLRLWLHDKYQDYGPTYHSDMLQHNSLDY